MIADIISGVSNFVGGLMGQAEKDKDRALQKEFAQQGVRWRVEDAKAAGIHPVFALGASGASFQPVGGTGIAEGVSSMGQNIAQAVDRTRTVPEKIDAYTAATQNLTLERMGLENQLLRAQIGAASSPPMPSGDYPMPGQPGSGTADVVMPMPFGIPGLPVANPDMAQKGQDHFGDVMEQPFGLSNFLDSVIRNIAAHSRPQDKARPGDRTPRWY